jgi:hypothetical protein
MGNRITYMGINMPMAKLHLAVLGSDEVSTTIYSFGKDLRFI